MSPKTSEDNLIFPDQCSTYTSIKVSSTLDNNSISNGGLENEQQGFKIFANGYSSTFPVYKQPERNFNMSLASFDTIHFEKPGNAGEEFSKLDQYKQQFIPKSNSLDNPCSPDLQLFNTAPHLSRWLQKDYMPNDYINEASLYTCTTNITNQNNSYVSALIGITVCCVSLLLSLSTNHILTMIDIVSGIWCTTLMFALPWIILNRLQFLDCKLNIIVHFLIASVFSFVTVTGYIAFIAAFRN